MAFVRVGQFARQPSLGRTVARYTNLATAKAQPLLLTRALSALSSLCLCGSLVGGQSSMPAQISVRDAKWRSRSRTATASPVFLNRRWQSQSMAQADAPMAGPSATIAVSLGGDARAPAGLGADLGLDDLIITPSAVRKLAALHAKAMADGKANAGKTMLRIRVDGGGCSGFKYSFQLEASDPEPDDRVFDHGTARVVVDTVSLDLIKGSTVDFHEEMMRASFAIVNNPQSESSCGCGSSFSAKA